MSYGWQATRRVSTVAALREFKPRRWTCKNCHHESPIRRKNCDQKPIRREKESLPSGNLLAPGTCLHKPKTIVYVLRSILPPIRYYTGVTSDVHARLEDHNAGRCAHTSEGRPWQLDVVVRFADERRALRFERYLKSGSGSAFAQRHLR